MMNLNVFGLAITGNMDQLVELKDRMIEVAALASRDCDITFFHAGYLRDVVDSWSDRYDVTYEGIHLSMLTNSNGVISGRIKSDQFEVIYDCFGSKMVVGFVWMRGLADDLDTVGEAIAEVDWEVWDNMDVETRVSRLEGKGLRVVRVHGEDYEAVRGSVEGRHFRVEYGEKEE